MKLLRSVMVSAVALAALTVTATALPLRAPQVAFTAGALQAYLDAADGGINVLTDQSDRQAWASSMADDATFTLAISLGLGDGSSIGVYNASDANPALYMILPPAATLGWYANFVFSGDHLFVALQDQYGVFQGQVVYSNVDASNFGFYVMGPCGVWYSQDGRNGSAGNAQMLSYRVTRDSYPDWWLCFEACPYDSASQFTGVVRLMPWWNPETPTHGTTWGALKSLYR